MKLELENEVERERVAILRAGGGDAVEQRHAFGMIPAEFHPAHDVGPEVIFESGGDFLKVSMKLIEGFDSNYRYILVAARRARQLQSGAPPVVQTNSRKPCRIAQDEIRAGKVKWEIPETRSAAEQAAEVLDKAFGHDA